MLHVDLAVVVSADEVPFTLALLALGGVDFVSFLLVGKVFEVEFIL